VRWETVPLGEVAAIHMGQAPLGESYNDRGEGLGLIAGPGDFSNGGLKVKKFTTSPTKRTRPGDLVVGVRASIGDLATADGEYCLGRGVAAVRPNEKLDSGYARQVLRWLAPELASRGRGATFRTVTRLDIETLPIPLPPLSEQRRIAAILDAADALRSTWGEIRDSTRRAISRRISGFFSKPTDIKPLAQLLAEPMRNGISPSRGGRYEGEVLTLSAITRGAFDPRQRKSDLFAAPHASDKLATEGLHLVCRGNGNAELVGAMVAVTDQPDGVAFPDTMIGFRPSSEINSPTLVAAWRHPTVRDQIRRAARTTNGTYKVNQQSLSSIMVPVPRREDQEQIAALDAERTKLDSQLAQGLVSLNELFASLQHRAFRGEL
jgi:type I restriction enzyme, S subunit|tara:strand:+ start:463 stop:1596 length:1134 start_codon:yes stop_codon:yes gene_type:complete